MAKTTYAAGLLSAMAAAAGLSQNRRAAHADGPFNFPPFSNLPQSSPSPTSASGSSDGKSPPEAQQPPPPPPKVRNDQPRTTSAGFDPEALERGVKALREISSSPHGKKVGTLHPG